MGDLHLWTCIILWVSCISLAAFSIWVILGKNN